MSQQINLLNPALIKKKDILSPGSLVMAAALLSALMLAYYSYIQAEISSLTQQRNQVAETLVTAQSQLKQTAMMHAPRAINTSLLDQITQLEQKEKIQQQVLETVSSSTSNPDTGYSALMLAFARQSLEGLWLTSFNMDSETNRLDIRGRTMQSELVPEYITRLGSEPVLKGKSFATLSMSLPKTNSAKPASAVESKAASGTASTKDNLPNVSEASTQPDFIEFSLQSTDKKADTTLQQSGTGGGV